MAIVAFPEPQDLKLEFKDMVLDGRNIDLNPYSVANPHPGFGTDPNILNEFGHTKYPMWVNGQIANNEAEEKALKGEPSVPAAPAPATTSNPWPTK